MIASVVGADSHGTGGLNLVLLFAVVVLGGTFGARLFQKLRIPQVVGCIVTGILLGDVLGVITPDMIDLLRPFTIFALGIIGFKIGGELRLEVFKKYGRQFFVILFAQGFGAFLLVAAGAGLLTWLATGNAYLAGAIGLVLGAIASATAPAATVNVLWEYKTRGPLTAAILAIVALDDALALLLYRGAATAAKALLGTGHESVLATTLLLLGEIVGAVLLGFLAGVLLYFLLKIVRSDDKILDFSLASLLFVVGIAMIPNIDPLLPAMTLGITIANLAPRESKNTFSLVQGFSSPIYIAFFVLAGAHMEFGRLTPWIVAMIAVYVVCRAFGKMAGAWYGARRSGAPVVVQRYLGMCLLPQAGVAIGLAILAGQQFDAQLGYTIIMIAMTATFLMEIVGPILVKVGVKRAGEVGMNVTEEDLIKSYAVKDVMDARPTTISQNLPLQRILEAFSVSDSVYYPVVDARSRITGIITITGIKEMFANRHLGGWLLAYDVAQPVLDKTTADTPLQEAMEHMQHYDLEYLPVVADENGDQLVGVLDYRLVNRRISAEVLRRRRAADERAAAKLSFPFPSQKIAEFFVAKLAREFQARGFSFHTLNEKQHLYQLRKDDTVVDIQCNGTHVMLDCDETQVPLVNAAMYEALGELEQAASGLKRPLGMPAAEAAVEPDVAAVASQSLVLRDYLTPQLIAPQLKGTTKTQIIDELLALLQRNGLLKDPQRARKAVWAREKNMSTGLQYGVAIPHGKTDAVDRLVCAVGVKKEGVDFNSMDGQPSKIFFLTLSPKADAAPHVQLMSTIGQVLDSEGRRRILACRTAEQIYEVLTAQPAPTPTSPIGQAPGEAVRFHLADYLRPELLEPDLKGRTKEQVIDELLVLLEQHGKLRDPNAAREAVLARESQMSTGMQEGIAIPHGRTNAVDTLVCAAGVKRGGVEFGSIDKKPARIIIMALTPESGADPYLRFVAAIVAVLDAGGRQRVLAAKTRQELYKALIGTSKDD